MSRGIFESRPTHVPGMLLPRFAYESPERIEDALALLAASGAGGHLLAGGTDLLVKMKRGILRPRLLVSLRRLVALRGIAAGEAGVRVGAMATMSQLAADRRLTGPYAALAEGAASVGGPLVRNRATVGGNVINARPCADTASPLLALGAWLRLASVEGERRVELDGFLRGPGETALASGEILTAIELPKPLPECQVGSCYLKVTRRAALEVTIVGCAASLQLGPDGRIRQARLVFTSVAPIPLRITAAEPILEGQTGAPARLAAAAVAARAAAQPIDDHRAPGAYRAEVVEVLARRALELSLKRAHCAGGLE